MTQPYPYQIAGATRMEQFGGRALLADSMGLGKTLQALLWAVEHKTARPIVAVCPAGLKWNWQRECLIHYNLRAEVIEGTKVPKGNSLLRATAEVFVINYDILGPWLKHLRSLEPRLVIIDEAHKCQGRSTQRTKNVRLLCKGVPHVIAMTGTPINSRPAELWPILNILRPDLWPSFWTYGFRYCDPKRKPWGWDFKGSSNLGELNQLLLENVMVRRTKEEVLTQLPPKRREVVALDIVNRKEYTEANKDFLGWLRKQNKAKAKSAERAQALVKVGYLKRLAAKLKTKAILEWVDEFLDASEEKLILFAVHKEMIATLSAHLGKACVVVDGSTTSHRRQLAVDQFHRDKQTRVFVGNIQAAGVGWDGTVAQTVAFAELGWTPGEHSQAEDRVHRIKQQRGTRAVYLVAKDTVEEKLCQILQSKQRVLSSSIDGDPEKARMDVFNQLLESILCQTSEKSSEPSISRSRKQASTTTSHAAGSGLTARNARRERGRSD